MATQDGLCNLGMPDELTRLVGYALLSITTTAATQNSAGGLLTGVGNKEVLVNVASAGHAVTLPSAAGTLDEIILHNTTANAGIVFPPTGGTINQLSANTATTSLAANASISFKRVSATAWRARPSAAVA